MKDTLSYTKTYLLKMITDSRHEDYFNTNDLCNNCILVSNPDR